ncbi:MAG: ribosome biogenesis GTP-binding protein YihA/YsxC [Myxococcales bacterium]
MSTPPSPLPSPIEVRVLDSAFVISAAQIQGAPPATLPEVCFAGRSNVGKSSAINALLGRRKLARVSNTPGRTRLLNFFTARLEVGGVRRALSLCDLPGYGYAKAPREEVARWRSMIEGYLAGRERLCGAVLLVDARHEPSELDRSLVGWLTAERRPVRVAVTKCDKIGKNQIAAALRGIERALGQPARSAIAFSAASGAGRDELWNAILELAGPA